MKSSITNGFNYYPHVTIINASENHHHENIRLHEKALQLVYERLVAL